MPNAEVQALVDSLASELRRSVVIDDPHVQMLYSSAHFGDEDPVRIDAMLNRRAGSRAIGHVLAHGVASWTRGGVIPANPELGMQARVCVPVRWRGELIALVMVMDRDGSTTTAQLTEITRVAELMAPLLADELLVDETNEQTILDLICPEPAVRRRALAEMASGAAASDFAVVTALWLAIPNVHAEASGAHVNVAMRSALTLPTPPGVHVQVGAVMERSAVVLLGGRREPGANALGTHAKRMLRRVEDLSSGRFSAVAGIGPSLTGLERAHETAEMASLASRGTRLGGKHSVMTWAELGAYGPLLRIPESQLGTWVLPAEVQQVLDVDRDGQLTSTLRAFLDAGTSASGASAALQIHRTTLYYRLGRIEELTGLDLADGRTRLTLHLGLTLMDLIPDFRHS